MKIGDKCFFYHTGKTKSIMGIVQIKKEAFLDKSDKTGKFVSVTVKAVYPLKKEVSLLPSMIGFRESMEEFATEVMASD